MRRTAKALVALMTAAFLVSTTACSAGLGGPASSRSAQDGVIRFTFAPDPIWDYMHDAGIVDEWQRETGYTIETSATWDEFGLFAWQHGWDQRADVRSGNGRPPREAFADLWFDTLTHDVAALELLRAQSDPTHLMCGSDYPFDMGTLDPLWLPHAAGIDDAALESNARAFLGLDWRADQALDAAPLSRISW